jgi:hypothetical protein
LTSNKLEESILNVEIRIFEERKKERASRSVVDADIDTRGSAKLPIEPRHADRQGYGSRLMSLSKH